MPAFVSAELRAIGALAALVAVAGGCPISAVFDLSRLDVLFYDVTVSLANELPLAVLLLSFQSPAPLHQPPGWRLGHFPTLLLCAIPISVVFACVFHSTTKGRILAAIRYFVILVVVSLAVAWLMLPFSH